MTDLLLANGTVHTMDPARPVARSIACSDGKVESLDETPPARRTIDLKGKTVVPGFIDAHVHLLQVGRLKREVDLTGVTSFDEVVRRVSERAANVMFALETDVGRCRRQAMLRWREARWNEPRRDHGERPHGRRVSTMCSTPIPHAGQRRHGAPSGAGVVAGAIGAGSGRGAADAAMSGSRAGASKSRRDGLHRP